MTLKKKFIVLAVAGMFALPALAQSNVSIGGYFAIQLKQYKMGNLNQTVRGPLQKAQNEYRVDDDNTSRIWFRGQENLGDGWDAHFYMESRFGTDLGSGTPSLLAGGNTFVGLGSKTWGVLDLGRLESYYIQGAGIESDRTGINANQANKAIMSVIGPQVINRMSRNDNNIRYMTPSLSGFRGTLVVTPNFGGDEGKIPNVGAAVNNDYSQGAAWMLAGEYANGPLFLNAAYWRSKTEGNPTALVAAPNSGYGTTAQADQRAWRISGSYKFDMGLKVGLMYDKSRLDNVRNGQIIGGLATAAIGGGTVTRNGSVSRSAWMLPVSYSFGPHAVYFKYAKAGSLSNFTEIRSGGSGARFYNLAYDYALSKRTVVGASFTKLVNDKNGVYNINGAGTVASGSGLVAGESARTLQLNLRHNF